MRWVEDLASGSKFAELIKNLLPASSRRFGKRLAWSFQILYPHQNSSFPLYLNRHKGNFVRWVEDLNP